LTHAACDAHVEQERGDINSLYQGAANQHCAEQQPSEAETILAEVTLVATRRTTMKLTRFVVDESPRKGSRFIELEIALPVLAGAPSE
jgi:hypothetical protein